MDNLQVFERIPCSRCLPNLLNTMIIVTGVWNGLDVTWKTLTTCTVLACPVWWPSLHLETHFVVQCGDQEAAVLPEGQGSLMFKVNHQLHISIQQSAHFTAVFLPINCRVSTGIDDVQYGSDYASLYLSLWGINNTCDTAASRGGVERGRVGAVKWASWHLV